MRDVFRLEMKFPLAKKVNTIISGSHTHGTAAAVASRCRAPLEREGKPGQGA